MSDAWLASHPKLHAFVHDKKLIIVSLIVHNIFVIISLIII